MSHKLTIIVPVYKVPYNYLEKCIESIINQTYENLEIILIDDGSPDDCGLICDKYQKQDLRINVIHKQNGGLSQARNTGVINATGDYLMFVDGDDWLEADCCEIVVNKILEKECDFLMFKVYKNYRNKEIKIKNYSMVNNFLYYEKDKEELLSNFFKIESNITSAYAKVFKTEFLRENNIYHNEDYPQGVEGFIFVLYCLLKFKKCYFLDEYLYHYMYNENSISSSHNEENHYLVLSGMNYIKKILEENGILEKYKIDFYTRINHIIITTAISGYFNPKNGLKYNDKKIGFINYMNNELIKETLNTKFKTSFFRKIVLLIIKLKLYFFLNMLAKLRYYYKSK